MLDFPNPSLQTQNLEPWIRAALILGELSPAAQAHINHLVGVGQLSASEYRLLALLKDAIRTGHIVQVQPQVPDSDDWSDDRPFNRQPDLTT